jgi:4-hydroxybenzoate polyprenyltransferase
VASLAWADVATAARLGLSMLGMQASIGALNDVVDAPVDATQKPSKPIPSGLVTARAGVVLGVVAGAVGLALSGLSGPATLVVAIGGLALGHAYNLWLSRTRWSWLPLSLALPLLPIHAWLGATGEVPPGLVALVPTAILAGTALAIANGLVDLERDSRAGRRAIAVELGRRRAWLVHAAILAIVAVLAVYVAPSVPSGELSSTGQGVSLEALGVLRTGGVGAGLVAVIAGAAALAARSAGIRERGWELEAVGVAAIGLGWLAGTAASAAGGA